jgi:signal transduction histidine kinase
MVHERNRELPPPPQEAASVAAACQSAIRQERARLSRELHDTLIQDLHRVVLGVEQVILIIRDGARAEAAIELLRGVQETARSGADEARRWLQDLGPSLLNTLGIELALSQLAMTTTAATGVLTTFAATGSHACGPETERALYRIAQEAVSNACRHANAKSIEIQLTRTARCADLSISDDGKGFVVPHSGRENSYGLKNMHARAEKVGGILGIVSRPGQGTTVGVTVARPVPPLLIEPGPVARSIA